MNTTTTEPTTTGFLTRVLAEGYGPGAWHGPDFKAAIADVGDDMAFRRPAAERHNIAEIALHHAYCVRTVRGRLTGTAPEPFVLEGDDWFDAPYASKLTWREIAAVVEAEHRKLSAAVEAIAARGASPLNAAEQIDVVLGITCHAVYHAGQVQLIKKLLS